MHTSPSLLDELPSLIAEGMKVAKAAVDRAHANRGTEARPDPSTERNTLIHGDNLDGLAGLVATNTQAKLVYLDPPFDSKADYRSRIHTRDDAGTEIALEMHTYTDRWPGGTADYLRMLLPRLILAKQLLRADGAICVHLDWHSSHYVRVALDEIFGRENFVNAIVWSYRTGGAARRSAVPRKHDDLLVYRCSETFQITPLYERQYLDKPFMGSKKDAQGRLYVDTILRDVLEGTVNLVNETGPVGETGAGRDTGLLTDSQSVHEVSVRPVLNLSAERTGYATQKPEGLLELLLRWMTGSGDLVIDPFGGSGTTAVAAEQLGRKWVSLDASARSLVVTRTRLDALGATYRVIDMAAADSLREEPHPEHQTATGQLPDRNQTDLNQPVRNQFVRDQPDRNQSAALEDLVEYTWIDGRFHLLNVRPAAYLESELEPARKQLPDAVSAAIAGSGLGALAGWHLWARPSLHDLGRSGGSEESVSRTDRRLAGAWRDARGNLVTSASIEKPPGVEVTLELVDLTGAHVLVPLAR